MRTGGMDKLARPDCTACRGAGKVRVPIELGRGEVSIIQPAPGQKVVGFIETPCTACGGSGKR